MAAPAILRDALACRGAARLGGPVAAQAFELALDPPGGAASSSGSATRAGRRRRSAAMAAGRRARCVDGVDHRQRGLAGGGRAPTSSLATVEMDHGWCHTVGYLSPIVAAAAAASALSGRPVDADGARGARPPGHRGRACRRARRIAPGPTIAATVAAHAPARRRHRRGPAHRARARAQGRGGRVGAVGDPRPRDVPPRPPAGDRRRDRRWSSILTDRDGARRAAPSAPARRSPRPRRSGSAPAAILGGGRGRGASRAALTPGRPDRRPGGARPAGAVAVAPRRPRRRSSS